MSQDLCDAVMLMAFGGPESAPEVRPFISRVLQNRPRSEERIEEVARRYQAIGGASPLNRLTFRQAEALRSELARRGFGIPVDLGMRNWPPLIGDALRRLTRQGVHSVLGLVMAPFQTPATLEYYRSAVEAERLKIGGRAPAVRFASGFSESEGFISANADLAASALSGIPDAKHEQTTLVFTAHSLPLSMAYIAAYEEQLQRCAELVARAVGHAAFRVCYQSRSGSPREKWLEPDIKDLIHELSLRGSSGLVVSPIGFVCDNLEVLYDLDVEAASTARDLGLTLRRASTIGDHPAFIRAIGDLVTSG